MIYKLILQEHVRTWKDSLTELTKVFIPRCFLPEDSNFVTRVEIHAYSDASDRAIENLGSLFT